MTDLTNIINAFRGESLPVNPLPFLNGLAEYVRENGTGSIQSDDAKRILWTILAQAYGSIATVDLCDEWQRLEAPPETFGGLDGRLVGSPTREGETFTRR